MYDPYKLRQNASDQTIRCVLSINPLSLIFHMATVLLVDIFVDKQHAIVYL